MVESIEALNRVLEEEIVETINHRLLTSLFANCLDVDQLNNIWSMQTIEYPYETHREIEVTQHVAGSLEVAAFRAPPRPPKPSHTAEKDTKNHQIEERILNSSQIETAYTNHTHNISSNSLEKTLNNTVMIPELPPRPVISVPSSQSVEPDSIRLNSPQNHRSPTPTISEKPSKSTSSPSKIAKKFLKSLVSSPSKPPEVPARNFSQYAPEDTDTHDTYSYQSGHIYEAIKPRVPNKVSSNNLVADVDTADTHSAPQKDERIALASNNHEQNARLISQEIMSNLRTNKNLGLFSKARKAGSISEETENSDTVFQDDARIHESRVEPFPVRENTVSMEETLYESPDEFDTEFNSSSEDSFTGSQNVYYDPVEEQPNDIYENAILDTTEKTVSVPERTIPNITIENTYNNIVDDVTYDEPAGRVYENTDELEHYDPITCWDTASTASFPCSWLAEEPLYQLTEVYGNQQKQDSRVSTFDGPGRNNFRRFSKELEQIHFRKVNGRTLWCNVESVISANVLGGMSRHEKDIQEAKFEIYTTEFSFLKSLKLLKKHFIMSSEFLNEKILSKSDRGLLFMYVKPLMARSKAFLRDLDECWKSSIFMHGIFDVICKHASKNFDIYITYCSYLNDTIEKLKELSARKNFLAALNNLQQSDKCCKLTLLSFLTLPMERITSLDLLIKKALSLLVKEDKSLETRKYYTDLDSCLLATDYVQRVCEKSDESCEIKRRIKRLIQLNTAFSYPANVCPLSLISEKRWLIMFGDVSKHDWVPGDRTKVPSAIARSISAAGIIIKSNYTIFLFSDYLVLAKKRKSDGSSFKVVDYCLRRHAKVVLPSSLQTTHARSVVDFNRQYKMLLIMNENHERKKVEMLLSCVLERERDLWLTSISEAVAVRPKATPTAYVCAFPFSSEEENHLSLVQGDEVTVIRKLGCGWLEGVRARDKKIGIFPPSRVKLADP